MLIIWQCCNIHKISASQLRNSHNNTMGQIFLRTYLNIYAGVPVATGDSTFCRYTWIRTLIHEWNSKITVSAKSSCQQEQVLFSQYLSQVKKVLWMQLYFVYFERVWEHTKKNLQLLSYCKGQRTPKPLMWWVKKERHLQKAVELPQAWTVLWRRLALSFVSKKSPCWNIHGAYRRLGFI